MNFTMPRSMLLIPFVAVVCLAGLTIPVSADDTEVFQVTASSSIAERPKVIILFDDSGSMNTVIPGQRPPYDPNKTDYDGGIDGSDFERVYWSDDENPPQPGGGAETRWFNKSLNRCESSFNGLDNQGFFSTGGAQRWQGSRTEEVCVTLCNGSPVDFWWNCLAPGNVITTQCANEDIAGNWSNLGSGDNSPVHVECKVDVTNDEPGNGPNVADGFPLDGVLDNQVYGATTAEDSNLDWGGTAYTFYSANYVDYWYDDSLTVARSRLDIAQDVISNLIATNSSIDFGLAIFNNNDDGEGEDGGRIITRIISDMSSTERTNLVDMVNDDLTGNGWTPLCESAYEVYRYLTGESVLFGLNRSTVPTVPGDPDSPDTDLPVRDLAAESGEDYIAPTSDCAYVYVILMTDGLPTYDDEATQAIEDLTGKTCRNWPDDIDDNSQEINDPKNCLPELAEYMANTDLDGDETNGNQFGLTYTIGFDLELPADWVGPTLLEEAAALGGGVYYSAESADQLKQAFDGAVLNILSTESTFTSPAVAVDTFTRTESRDDIYYAMFKPDDRVDWPGNIKKLKIAVTDDGLMIVDKNGDAAIDPATGFIKADADTFWSSDDGGAVLEGGVGELLANRDPATRAIYTNTGVGGGLETFNSTNLTYDAFGLASSAELFAYFGVSSQAALDTAIAYGQGFGINADGSSTGSARDWIFGDPLHSQPIILNYGALGGFDENNPDLRVLVGTNAGFLHMFGDTDGQEDWAFFPKEYGAILNQRRINGVSNNHVYGLDLTPVVRTKDVNRDGTISSSDGDEAWVYSGMRRGGRDLYALDVSNPNSPSFLWRNGAADPGLLELGWTWSAPVVTTIPGYSDNAGVPKPVVIVGAGYDPNKDSSGVGTVDSMGRGVFIFDAQTGAVVRSITPATGTSINLQEAAILHSVPAKVAILDSNGDELTDRLYFADTGGNIWRVDIGSTLPTPSTSETWKIVKFAQLNGGTIATDRRFFNAVDVVRIRTQDQAADVVMIGSGDRANPLGTDVNNAFYLLRDFQTAPYNTDAPATCDPDDLDYVADFRCALPLQTGNLFDITSDVLNSGTVQEIADAKAALAGAAGWQLRLTGDGEKSLSDSITIEGKVAFTTFTPAEMVTTGVDCRPRSGQGLLYLVDIYDGERDLVQLGDIIPDTPSVIVKDGEFFIVPPPRPGTPPGDGNRDGIIEINKFFPAPFGNYWYREEY
jgi:type IV pilus assembly protein PilY1